jgi:hypothetical protein
VLRAQDRAPGLGSNATAGIHVGPPADLSLAIGRYQEIWRADTTRHSESRFWFLAVEPGADAGRLSAGYGSGILPLYTYLTARLTALRLWRDDPVASYVGVEGEMTVLTLSLRVGAFARRGSADLPRVRLAIDVGLGM